MISVILTTALVVEYYRIYADILGFLHTTVFRVYTEWLG